MSSDHINVSMTFTAFAMNMPPKTSFSSEIGMSIKGILSIFSSSVFFVSSKGHELDLFSIGSSRFESFLLLG